MKRMMMMWVALAACGGSSPEDKCEDFVDRVCDRTVECVADARGMHEQCVSAIQGVFSCGRVKSVTENYDSCMDGLGSLSCEALFPISDGEPSLDLPPACSGVLKVEIEPAIRAAVRQMRGVE